VEFSGRRDLNFFRVEYITVYYETTSRFRVPSSLASFSIFRFCLINCKSDLQDYEPVSSLVKFLQRYLQDSNRHNSTALSSAASHRGNNHKSPSNSMEHCPSWEANSQSASQEIPRLLSNSTFITVSTRACH